MSATQEMGPENDLIKEAVRELARRTRFPVAFGGLIEEGVVAVTSIVGNRTHSLDGLKVHPDRGLGGRAMMELRPRMTNDYRTSTHITHDYDVFVLGEGLRTLFVTTARKGRPAEELARLPASGHVLARQVEGAGLPVHACVVPG